jgi:biotin synthase-related radical SAM superfamily protein
VRLRRQAEQAVAVAGMACAQARETVDQSMLARSRRERLSLQTTSQSLRKGQARHRGVCRLHSANSPGAPPATV